MGAMTALLGCMRCRSTRKLTASTTEVDGTCCDALMSVVLVCDGCGKRRVRPKGWRTVSLEDDRHECAACQARRAAA
jgi:hypothetical protein